MAELSWESIRELVYQRANGCCEYCQTCEENIGQTMHIDHIQPDGGDDLNNLCLACWNCNTSKHTATVSVDPQTKRSVPLFNPRTQIWAEHFRWINQGTTLYGLTDIGRATVERLKTNRPLIVIARQR